MKWWNQLLRLLKTKLFPVRSVEHAEHIDSFEQWENTLASSNEHPVLLFKYSPR